MRFNTFGPTTVVSPSNYETDVVKENFELVVGKEKKHRTVTKNRTTFVIKKIILIVICTANRTRLSYDLEDSHERQWLIVMKKIFRITT